MKKKTDLGEFGLIDLLTRGLLPVTESVVKGIGDDTAVLKADPGKWLLFTTDMIIEGVHFSLGHSTPRQVGWKALAVNLSDIAAMGGLPSHALVSLGVPAHLETNDLIELYGGLKDAAETYLVNIVGGDTVSSPDRLVLNVALLGEVAAGKAVYRSGARPGDLVFVTGPLGAAAAGLYLLQNPGLTCPVEVTEYCCRVHTEPKPRLDAGVLLARCGVSALDDISDGLASEMHEICSASGVGCLLRQERVPIDPRVRILAETAGVDPFKWALFGGEDFELVFTASPDVARRVEQEALAKGVDIYQVGEITGSGTVFLVTPEGDVVPLPRGGYDHFGGT